MRVAPAKIDLADWEARHGLLIKPESPIPPYCGPLSRHLRDGDLRLRALKFDNSFAAFRLWNFLLTEEERLHAARASGMQLVGAMKDLGTVPVMAYSLPNLVAFYPDGAWWVPCLMAHSDGLNAAADALGVDDSFCPVRAMLGAFATGTKFPLPDLLTCSVGATCDDFAAIAQRIEAMGHAILWWEMPHRRCPEPTEATFRGLDGRLVPACQVQVVRAGLERVRRALETLAGTTLEDDALRRGIAAANRIRDLLRTLRKRVYTAPRCPLPALEMLIAEMLAIHYCSDRGETASVLEGLLDEIDTRVEAGVGCLPEDAVRVFWVNPVADLRVMNLLEDCGGRLCGTEFLFCHALDPIPESLPPMDALALTALADPMAGTAAERAGRVLDDALRFGAEAVVVSRIPGASHCATEGEVILDVVRSATKLPAIEIEVPSVCDALAPNLTARIQALVEVARERRRQ